MTRGDYLDRIRNIDIDEEVVALIQKQYNSQLPDIVKRILTYAKNTVFLDGLRILSVEEIIDAENDLHVDFSGKYLLPIADCGDNDFIVLNMKNGTWSMFNIVDEVAFAKKNSFTDYLK